MNARLANQIVNEGDLIDDLTQRCGDLGQRLATLTELLPSPRSRERRPVPVLKQFDFLTGIPRLPVAFDEFRLVVEQVHVRSGPCHEELHDALRLGREVHHVHHAPARGDDGLRPGLRAENLFAPQH